MGEYACDRPITAYHLHTCIEESIGYQSLLIEEVFKLAISVKAGQLVEFEEGVVVGVEGVLSKQLGIVAFQPLERPHRNQELIGLLHRSEVPALLIDFVFQLEGCRLALLSDAKVFVLRSAGKIKVQKKQLPGEDKM